ncbi:hypothetical protein CICLE_v10024147mg [Citrus x clementina]|uniref:Uncharacterized protein n=1 Tax=Citrus clementina TaxID=85681 RepID=V4TRM6_CITCL|nr:hypothetical protein CICLE_v10024147mg [Citrus x clementina]
MKKQKNRKQKQDDSCIFQLQLQPLNFQKCKEFPQFSSCEKHSTVNNTYIHVPLQNLLLISINLLRMSIGLHVRIVIIRLKFHHL